MLEKNKERCVQKAEACHILGISRATFDRWRKRYETFPKSRNPNPRGRCIFWLPDLLKWAEENRPTY
jgi:predicted DNA-binding transcriptional regulator AlpA